MRISDWSSDVCSSDLHQALAHLGQVRQHRLLVLAQHLSARRHPDDQGRRCGAGHVPALAVCAPPGLEVLGIAEVDEGVQAVCRLEYDVAAAPAVAAVGAAELDELLAAERHAAVAAVAALQEHLGFVEELHRACSAAMRRARCHDSRVSRKRLASANSWRASLHWRAMPLARKPAFSSTRPEAGLSAK